MITPDIKKAAASVLPSQAEIASQLGVSKVTVSKVFNGKSKCKKVVDYILKTTAEEQEKVKMLSEKILKNAC